MRLDIFILLFSLFTNMSSMAQTAVPSVQFGATPTVSGLAQYADTTIGYNAGIPSISIPIFTINTGDYSLPISLSYHAGGIKLAQEASWVGLGWSLNAGGIITRQIRGENDINTGNGIRSYLNSYGDYEKITSIGFFDCSKVTNFKSILNWRCGHLPTNISEDLEINYLDKIFDARQYWYKDEFFEEIPSQPHVSDTYVSEKTIIKKLSDTEPDLFMYNFGGFTGKFILQSTGVLNRAEGRLIDNSQNHKIEFFNIGRTPYFKITDADGTIYHFNKRDISTSTATQHLGEYISGWHLTKIITSNNREILFEYQTDEEYIFNHTRKTETVDYYSYANSQNPSKWIQLNKQIFGLKVESNTNTSNTNINASSHLLKKISWDGGSVVFNTGFRDDYGTGTAKKLTDIEIFDTKMSLTKKVLFKYDYFNNDIPETHPAKNRYKRLKLLSLEEQSSSDYQKKLPPYKFKYHEEKGLPAKNDNYYDYWGYSTAAKRGYSKITPLLNTGKSIPEIFDFQGNKQSSYGGSNRNAIFEYTVLGTLNEIEYPTGGKVNYKYELNTFFKKNSFNGADTSLRRKKYSLFIRNYMSHATPFRPYNQDNIGQEPNFEDFTIFDTANVESYRLTFEMTKPFYDRITGIDIKFSLDLYRLDGASKKEVLVEQISIDNFRNSTNWYDGLPYMTFIKDFDQPIATGMYRLRFSKMQNYYNSIPEADQYLTGQMDFVYTGDNTVNKTDPNSIIESYDAGGLRIKKIISPKNIREFTYTTTANIDGEKEDVSSGSLLSTPKYWETVMQPITPYKNHILRFRTESSVPTSGGVQGNIVGYSNVKETFKDLEGIVMYANSYGYRKDDYIEKPFVSVFSSLINNKLSSLTKYNSNNKILESTSYNYQAYLIDNVQGTYIYDPLYITHPINTYLNTRYLIPLELVTLSAQERRIYGSLENDQPPIVHKQKFDYEIVDFSHAQLTNHRQVVNTEDLLDNGKKQITKIYRPYEMLKYVEDLSSDQRALMEELIAQNRVNTTVQTMIYKELEGVEKLLSTSRLEFQKTNHHLIVPKFFKTAIGTANLETTIEYVRYDDKGNILEIRDPQTNVYTAYIYGYNKTLPVAKIENARLADISSILNLTNLELENFNQSNLSKLNTLRAATALKDAMVTTYTYKELVGVHSTTDQRGRTITYHYDGFNRLQYVTNHKGEVLSENEYYYKNQQ